MFRCIIQQPAHEVAQELTSRVSNIVALDQWGGDELTGHDDYCNPALLIGLPIILCALILMVSIMMVISGL